MSFANLQIAAEKHSEARTSEDGRHLQGLVLARAWRFKSSSGHSKGTVGKGFRELFQSGVAGTLPNDSKSDLLVTDFLFTPKPTNAARGVSHEITKSVYAAQKTPAKGFGAIN